MSKPRESTTPQATQSLPKIVIHRVSPANRRPRPGDESQLGFGQIFSDHIFLMEYEEGQRLA